MGRNCSVSIEFKIATASLWVMNYLSSTTPFSQTKHRMPLTTMSLFLWKVFKAYSLIPPVLTFTAKIHPATPISVKHPRSLRIPLMKYKLYTSSFFSGTTAFYKPNPKTAITVVICSKVGLIVIFLAYQHKLYFLLCKSLPRVTLGPFRW